MQIVCCWDNLHEMPVPIFWGEKENYFNMLSAETFTQHAKR